MEGNIYSRGIGSNKLKYIFEIYDTSDIVKKSQKVAYFLPVGP